MFEAVSRVGVVAVLTVYFMADMRRIRATVYRFVPNSRRPRAILIGDAVMAKFGDYVFGNILTALAAIPIAAALQLLVSELLFPKLDQS